MSAWAKNKTNMSGRMKLGIVRIKTVIVGFGLSAIPLIKELEKSNQDFKIISKTDTIWRAMDKLGRLDFDLVSSMFTSFYTEDLVKKLSPDIFPTAKAFYDYQMAHYQQYKDQIIDDEVTHVENFDDYSRVYTSSGVTYEAKFVVMATGYQRKITQDILNFDYSIKNKTVVFNTIGDTSNMMLSKLIANNNKIIVLQNGFYPTDKINRWKKDVYMTLDQSEMHSIAFHMPGMYEAGIKGTMVSAIFSYPNDMMKWFIKEYLFGKATSLLLRVAKLVFLIKNLMFMGLARLFESNIYTNKVKVGLKVYLDKLPKMPVPNGFILVKYWPLDIYHAFFSENLNALLG
jgi:hypothetical protein